MTAYTFNQSCPKNVYTKIATGVNEIAATLPVPGRLVVQDTADADPTVDQTLGIGVGSSYPINLAITGLEVFYMPLGVDTIVSGMKK